MKQLMENWRKFLNEGMDSRIKSQLDKLAAIKAGPAGELRAGVVLIDYKWGASVQYCFIKPDGSWFEIEPDDSGVFRGGKAVQTDIPLGAVMISKEDENCLEAFEVISSTATRGFGPLLYEVALEYASQKGGGLMADRDSVSDYAMAVWGKYDSRSDVKSAQLDIDMTKTKIPDELGDKLSNLTDTPDDDCNQSKAVRDKALNWDDTPMSKVYIKKSTEVMSALGDRLIIDS